jgi:hypothetical protein
MRLLAIFVGIILNLNCASPGTGPTGLVFTKVKIGIFATGEKSTMEGRSCIHSLLGLLSFGDASISKIKDLHGIKEVTDVNWETNNYFGIYASLCIVVGGKK